MRRSSAGTVFGAFLGGAVLGGVLALLFAPRSGAETRGMIRDFVDDEIDMIKDRAAAARDYVEDGIEKYSRKARRMAEEISEMVEDAKECVDAEKKHVAKVMSKF